MNRPPPSAWSLRTRRGMLATLGVLAPTIWGLYKLSTLPYRAPQYGGWFSSEGIVIAWDTIGVLVVVWLVLLARFVCSFAKENGAGRLRKRRIEMFAALTAIGLVNWGLYKLATLPYRPPEDMSTFLGQEVIFIWGTIGILSVAWFVIVARLVKTLMRNSNGPTL